MSPTTPAQPKGLCFVCGNLYSKGGMSRHLKRHIAQSTGDTPLVWLRVEDATPFAMVPSTAFWLDLEVPFDLPLTALDRFLRAIWVECCGHLSQFVVRVAGQKHLYEVPSPDMPPEGPLDIISDWLGGVSHSGLVLHSMAGVTVGDLLAQADAFEYEYDFGTTTHLTLKAKARYQGPRPDASPPIRILSRNLKPRIPCAVCGQPAEYLSGEDGWSLTPLCATHADERDEEFVLPLVNSPRAGLCGYTGPVERDKWSFEV